MSATMIYVGGWFQRTSLHLGEIYDFCKGNPSPLNLNESKLAKLRKDLELTTVQFVLGDLDCIHLTNKNGIEVKIFEDGLLVLGTKPKKISKDIEKLTYYYENELSKAFNYIFSLGAPVPKELAGITSIYPYFIVFNKEKRTNIEKLLKEFNQTKTFEIDERTFEIIRGDKLYIINNTSEKAETIEKLVQEQIFIREFGSQMHRYLNIHRIVWEKIADVKERGKLKGKEIGQFKTQLESYRKTINLIGSRINQMDSYVSTRKNILRKYKNLDAFENVLHFKHDTLLNTLAYLKNLWSMTENYVNRADALFAALQAKSTEASVNNLAIITSMGVGATLIGLFANPEVPKLSWLGASYFFALAFVGFTANKLIKILYSKRVYEITDTQLAKDIK